MLGRAFTILSALSLAMCGAVCALWLRSLRPVEDNAFLPSANSRRYSVSSSGGRMTVFAPPHDGEVTADRATDWRGLFADFHLVCAGWRPDGRRIELELLTPYRHTWRTPRGVAGPENATAADLTGPVLDALDSDQTFAVAHWVLSERLDGGRRKPFGFPPGWQDAAREPADSVAYNGLVMRFAPGQPTLQFDELGHYMVDRPAIDPAQRPTIRDYWHRRLRVPLFSIAHGWLIAATAFGPLCWSTVKVVASNARRSARRRGYCAHCRYDMRVTPERCPECRCQPVR